MFGEEAKKEIMKIPVSNNTIQRRIIDLVCDIEGRFASKLQNTPFALQIDKSTQISGKAILLGFIRFVKENRIVNEFLCCRELPERTIRETIYNIINSYFERFKFDMEHH